MDQGVLGKHYRDGEDIIKQGARGSSMYVIQTGKVEVVQDGVAGERRLAILKPGDFFGEMSIFEKEVRSATVRALGEAQVLKVDKKTLFRRIKEDPLLAVNLLKAMSKRLRRLDAKIARLETGT